TSQRVLDPGLETAQLPSRREEFHQRRDRLVAFPDRATHRPCRELREDAARASAFARVRLWRATARPRRSLGEGGGVFLNARSRHTDENLATTRRVTRPGRIQWSVDHQIGDAGAGGVLGEQIVDAASVGLPHDGDANRLRTGGNFYPQRPPPIRSEDPGAAALGA